MQEPPPTKKLCDATAIVTLLKQNDPEGLDQATRCYGEQLLVAARRYCRSPSEADDAVQDALLGAWRYAESFRGEGRIDRWLVRLVATACSRMRRGRKNDPHLHVSDTELLADETPEQLTARSELAETLAHCLLELPPIDRAIVILSDAQGLDGPEIARELDMTPGAVRSRLSRVHRRLRERLEPFRHDRPLPDGPPAEKKTTDG
ncbi:MAG: sigma-70 family RNA polymerase sigma factor [Polyangiaceae bacterium]